MPLTVITLRNAPQSLRGHLSKWMQEIATGVYVGNFNSKVRDLLWEIVKDTVDTGEATISYAYRNEIGYKFQTYRTQRECVDYDGIPLIKFLNAETMPSYSNKKILNSLAAKHRKSKVYNSTCISKKNNNLKYVVIDVETDGLNCSIHSIIEIGAVKINNEEISEFHKIVKYENKISNNIKNLTDLNESILLEGVPIKKIMSELLEFIDDYPIVGYNVGFDINFINNELLKLQKKPIRNISYDLLKFVKKEKEFLNNYRLENVLEAYDIYEVVPHRALLDARLVYKLSTKVIKFLEFITKN